MIYHADARQLPLPDNSVHCVVTSPPYFGLRDYGTATWEGGDASHAHDRVAARNGRGGSGAPGKQTPDAYPSTLPASICACGAQRIDQQLGLEKTPEEYIAQMVAVFREVRRVMRDDAVCWLNLGDSYANDTKWGGTTGGKHAKALHGNGAIFNNRTANSQPDRDFTTLGLGRAKRQTGYKPKDLMLMPARLALALQADGWWVRSDVIWAKPNPMPESVQGSRWELHRIRDEAGEPALCPGCAKCSPNDGFILSLAAGRPTRSHESVFLLTKNESYFYDSEAIAEPVTGTAHGRGNGVNPKVAEPGSGIRQNASFSAAVNQLVSSRNKRDVWTIPSQAFSAAHFATFPEALVMPCVLAGTSAKGCCATCAAPWVREVATSGATLSWRATCTHRDAQIVPCTVLDPFLGSGTTAVVAERLGRNWIGVELSAEYIRIAEQRTCQGGLFGRAAAN